MKLKSTLFALIAIVSILPAHFEAGASTVVRNQYIVFSDRADLESYLKTSMPKSFSELVPYTDPRYASTEAILQRVWQGYQQFSPASTDQLSTPALVILKGNFLDGFVTPDPKSHFYPNAFFIYEKVAQRPAEEIAGLIAHELTHLLTPTFQFKYYQVSAGQEPLGYLQVNDPKVEGVVKQWQAITEVVGPVYIPELNGLPAPIISDGQLFNVISHMAVKWGDSKNPACQTVQNPLPDWRLDLVLRYVSMIDQVVRMTDHQRKEIDRQTRAYVSDLRVCLGKLKGQLIPLLQEILNRPVSELELKYAEIAKIFDQGSNVVEGIFAVTTSEYQKLSHFKSTHDLTSFRAYTNEEVADDNSVRILRLVGYSPASIGDFFLALAEDAQPGSRAQCESILNSGAIRLTD